MPDAPDDGLTLDNVNFFDPEISECPYPAYEVLRDEAPVWRDPRHRHVRRSRATTTSASCCSTPRRFINGGDRSRSHARERRERAQRIKALYEEKGWVPARTLAGRDDPEHRQMRALFDHAFRPAKIKLLDPFVERARPPPHRRRSSTTGRCDWVRQFAVPLPLIVIGKQMGAPEEDIWQIKAWTDAWVQRLGMMQTEEEAIWSTEMEIEAQHYFQPIFERLRARARRHAALRHRQHRGARSWGRTLTDEELHAEMMADTFVGGSETSTNALSAGVMLLVAAPDGVGAALAPTPTRYLPTLVEEVLRLEGPVQGLFRTTRRGGRAARRHHPGRRRSSTCATPPPTATSGTSTARPTSTSTASNTRSHLAFGAGTHFCLGRAARPPRAATSGSRRWSSASSDCGSSRAQRLPPPAELLPAGPEGAAHRVHPGAPLRGSPSRVLSRGSLSRASPVSRGDATPGPAGRGDHLVDERRRLRQLVADPGSARGSRRARSARAPAPPAARRPPARRRCACCRPQAVARSQPTDRGVEDPGVEHGPGREVADGRRALPRRGRPAPATPSRLLDAASRNVPRGSSPMHLGRVHEVPRRLGPLPPGEAGEGPGRRHQLVHDVAHGPRRAGRRPRPVVGHRAPRSPPPARVWARSSGAAGRDGSRAGVVGRRGCRALGA